MLGPAPMICSSGPVLGLAPMICSSWPVLGPAPIICIGWPPCAATTSCSEVSDTWLRMLAWSRDLFRAISTSSAVVWFRGVGWLRGLRAGLNDTLTLSGAHLHGLAWRRRGPVGWRVRGPVGWRRGPVGWGRCHGVRRLPNHRASGELGQPSLELGIIICMGWGGPFLFLVVARIVDFCTCLD